jgi:hypothetical protein
VDANTPGVDRATVLRALAYVEERMAKRKLRGVRLHDLYWNSAAGAIGLIVGTLVIGGLASLLGLIKVHPAFGRWMLQAGPIGVVALVAVVIGWWVGSLWFNAHSARLIDSRRAGPEEPPDAPPVRPTADA